MEIKIDQNRLAEISILRSGGHQPNDEDMCVMEAVAYVTHKKWSDSPPCVCPVLGAFMRSWNDGIQNDDVRTQLLKPLIPQLLNTKGSASLERRRATIAADWFVRVQTVAWLRLAKLDAQADALASLPEITDFSSCPPLKPALDAARNSAAAAWDAAGDAARAAARAAAWDAAWAAARTAARDALKVTVVELQQSALDLVKRMIEAKE